MLDACNANPFVPPLPSEAVAALPSHPMLWRASELARGGGRVVATGYPALSAALPGGGWPLGNLIELLLPQAGIGELRLLRPALSQAGGGTIALLQPPYRPNAQAWAGMAVPASQLLWLRGPCADDALWAAEQVLRSGSCGALLLWQARGQPLRDTALRRLHLAAQHGATLFCLMRPLAAGRQASPAILRLSLQAAAGGITIGFLKRRGPRRDASLFLPLDPSPVSLHRHASMDRLTSAATSAGSVLPDLVG